jgi:Tol biopolymer transport system component
VTLTPGTRLGPYEIVSPLGAGGMGEVYRATDTRLGRTVAIKVLPAHLSTAPEVRERFEREARAISSLSHAHICTLHDIGRQDGIDYLVMEYLEGETLVARLAKGPLAPDQVLRYGIEIAEALDRAHRQGIVHRDLKPGNVMITKAGAKLLDFGLAKFRPPTAVPVISSAFTSLPTEAKPLTTEGSIVGTFQYMSPEQLEGKEPDARTDIVAFGVLLYEMATGRKAFTGKSQASLIAAILEREPPPISSLQPMSPPALDRVVRTCLAKDPDDRWQNAHDLWNELRWIQEAGSAAGVAAPVAAQRNTRERLAWVAAATCAAAAIVFAGLWIAGRTAPAVTYASMLAPEKAPFEFTVGPMAVSPDGRQVAFVAGGERALWVRRLDGAAAVPLPATRGANAPFWSPDNRFVAFFADGKLKKIDVSGGPAQILADAPQGRGGSWSREGVIVFCGGTRDGLSRVASSGGPISRATRLDVSRAEFSHRWPWFLPDGRHFLFLIQSNRPDTRGIAVASLDSPAPELLVPGNNSNPAYSPPGYLLFFRDRTVLAQPFDARRLRLEAEPFPVGEDVQDFGGSQGHAIFSASQNGVLAYQGGSSGGLSQLTWSDRSGKTIETIGEPGPILWPRLSHDGRRVAYQSVDAGSGTGDVWVYDLTRRVPTRLTFDPADDTAPMWSPDDSRIAFCGGPNDSEIHVKSATGAGRDELLYRADRGNVFLNDWSKDGRFILFSVDGANSRRDVWALSVADRKATPWQQTPVFEAGAQFSPDGKWIAYISDESGRFELYVQPFPGPGGKWQISKGGGLPARWRADGRELFYVSFDRKLMAVDVKAGDTFENAVPRVLFESRIKVYPGWQFDVTPDGQRFLIDSDLVEASSAPITLVLNWTAGVKR